jgi:cyanophycin synthetase
VTTDVRTPTPQPAPDDAVGVAAGSVLSIRHYQSGNRHGRRPVSVARLRAPQPGRPDPTIRTAITTALTALALPHADGVEDAAAFGAVVGAVTCELLRVTVEPAVGHRVLSAAAADATVEIVFFRHRAGVGERALRLALDLLAGRQSGRVSEAVAEFRQWARPIQMHDQDGRLADVAEVRGIPWRASPLGQGPLMLGEGARMRRTYANMTDRTGFLGIDLCSNKWLANRTLRAAGLPASDQRKADSAAEAQRAAADLGYPVVVKPANTSRGAGIGSELGSPKEVADAFAAASRYGPVIVETFLRGDDFRLLVIGGRYFSTMRRRAAAVMADGERTVADLVARENARRTDTTSGFTGTLLPLPLDGESDRVLACQGLNRGSVAPAGTEVRLRAVSNWSQGGTFDFPTAIHPANIRLAERVAALFGLDIVGVDFIAPDMSRPFHEVGAVIHEVQRQPSTGLQNTGVFERLMDHVVPPGTPVRIPIVAVLGAGAGAVVGSVAARLEAAGMRVGVADAGGLRVGRLQRSVADARADGLPLLVDDPSVEAAVVEIDPDVLLDRGLGHGRIDVAILAGEGWPVAAVEVLAALADRGFVCAAADGPVRAAAGRAGLACVAIPSADAAAAYADAAITLLDGTAGAS